MVDHKKDMERQQGKANFYPVDGIRGTCTCGKYFHFISFEGEVRCPDCGKLFNVYVDHDVWEDAE
jgi:hypothetical protein